MSDKERKIMEKCGATIPQMQEQEKERFMCFMEGVAFITAQQRPIMTLDSAERTERRT